MLKVELAGYNVDASVLLTLREKGWDGKDNITPETISAAYARISRDERNVTELRAEARDALDRARKSNQNIVFRMGHHSVAEHAYLNFDIMGLSRLAVEALEESRLCSFTEKSQRYITLRGDTVIPAEFGREEAKIFMETVNKQVEAYRKLFPLLHEYQKIKNPGMADSKQGQNTIEGWAKEDARYVLSMATECQLGFSANARNIEYIIRKLKYHPLAEARELSEKLLKSAKKVVPSLIILSDPEVFKKQTGAEVSDGILKEGRGNLKRLSHGYIKNGRTGNEKDTLLLSHTADPDALIIASLLFSPGGGSYSECLSTAKGMNKKERKDFMKAVFKDLGEHDELFREFENAAFLFEIVISSSAFAQMKRHRLMTLIKQPYDTGLGVTMPPSISDIGEEDAFYRVIRETEKSYRILKQNHEYAGDYLLTNAHRRRILININLREIYHMARLRMDKHAQWDIRNVATEIVEAVKKTAPAAAALACGKDLFEEIKNNYYIKK